MKAGARPRRGAPPKGEASARERILATANELFYREGVRAIGVDTVVERSGVSKTSLYRVFESKDALIAAFAAERNRASWVWWDRIEEQHADDPRALLEALLSEIARRIGGPAYRGCPFLNLPQSFLTRTIPAGSPLGPTRRKCGPGSQRSSPGWALVIPTASRLR
jgi:AcrR family transcriptional regulator